MREPQSNTVGRISNTSGLAWAFPCLFLKKQSDTGALIQSFIYWSQRRCGLPCSVLYGYCMWISEDANILSVQSFLNSWKISELRLMQCCLLCSTPMRLKRNFRLLLQLISFSITKTFHGLSQVSLIYEANKPSNNKNLLKSWYSSLLSLSVNVWHGTLILASVISGCLPQTQHFTAARGLALSMLFLCSSQMTFKWMQVSVLEQKFLSCEHISQSISEP